MQFPVLALAIPVAHQVIIVEVHLAATAVTLETTRTEAIRPQTVVVEARPITLGKAEALDPPVDVPVAAATTAHRDNQNATSSRRWHLKRYHLKIQNILPAQKVCGSA